MFGAAEIFALLLSEIDLSVGYVAGRRRVHDRRADRAAGQTARGGWGSSAASSSAPVIGALQGTLITRLGLPSFIVTLGGLLGFEGVMLELANVDKTAVGGVMSIIVQQPGRQARQPRT